MWEGRFAFAEKTITAHADPAVEMLNAMDCGPSDWAVDAAQDILADGCPGLGQYPGSMCAADHDILRVQGDTLHFGDRPADNNMCEAAKRPTALSGLGFVKQ